MKKLRTLSVVLISLLLCTTFLGNASLSAEKTDQAISDDSFEIHEIDGTISEEELMTIVYDLFMPIIDAYATLERSGFTVFDEELIGDSLLTIQQEGTYNFGWDSLPYLLYSFYDINGDGMPEMLIGADEGYGAVISGIYTLLDNNPISVIQGMDRYYLTLLEDITGNCVIEYSWGHMGYADECFYTIDEAGELMLLDALFTEEVIESDNNRMSIRSKKVGDEDVVITEDEYTGLILKYGSPGYESSISWEEARFIDLDWTPILAENIGYNYDDDLADEDLNPS